MAAHKVVVIGGSAGSMDALQTILRGLPPALPAAVLVVVHLPPGVSRLANILARASPLPVRQAGHGDAIKPGHVYVAPPELHLLVRDGHLELGRGPRENHARPAIDVTMRMAARAFGRNVLGVLLSGAQSDGTLGLMAVKTRGGTCLVQDPEEAVVTSMPNSAVAAGVVDEILKSKDIVAAIKAFAEAPVEGVVMQTTTHSEVENAPDIIANDIADQLNGARHGMPSLYSCPDCGGVMWQMNEGELFHFYCHLGHSYAPETLLVQRAEELEDALWQAVRALREKGMLARQMAKTAREAGNLAHAERLDEQADADERNLNLIRRRLLGGAESPITEKQSIDTNKPEEEAGEATPGD